MATMLLMVAGVRSWDAEQTFFKTGKIALSDIAGDDATKAPVGDPVGDQAMVSSLSLNAVITPAISFDFYQYFYFLPSAIWSFEPKEVVSEVAYAETTYLLSCFNRIFGRYIVTNAP
ncbi:hypothetical protein DSL64_20150 [Dyadobacter luteus]|jgi:hypothetical protein|uniref:Uncharacterized protein n=2 Tax=Dyadobacter luteus TaxID=2259619 RepID=A0A3D8Y6Z8_9BACT|nr:hypothetical protein DSL64_20150 [Dyadobacter luteus]